MFYEQIPSEKPENFITLKAGDLAYYVKDSVHGRVLVPIKLIRGGFYATVSGQSEGVVIQSTANRLDVNIRRNDEIIVSRDSIIPRKGTRCRYGIYQYSIANYTVSV